MCKNCILACFFTCFISIQPVFAAPSAAPLWSDIDDTIVDTEGLTINSYGWAINGLPYQQEAVLTYNGWQYMAFYRGTGTQGTINGHVCVGRRKLSASKAVEIRTGNTLLQGIFSIIWPGTDNWQIIELADYTFSTNDAHNMISMGICPKDGTIHLSFDHHGDDLNYRVSKTGAATNPDTINWDASLFGPTRNYLISGQTITGVTYPRFWQTLSGDLQIGFRTGTSGDGGWCIGDYDGTSSTWTEIHQVIDSTGYYNDGTSSGYERNPYLNAPIGYDSNGRLHITWTWREGSGTANHDIMYAYSDDGGDTWYDNSGRNKIADSSTGLLIDLDSTGVTVVTLSSYYGMMNQQGQAIDSEGNVHVLMWHCTADSYSGYSYSRFGSIGARRYYHYWRNAQTGIWTRNQLHFDTANISSYVGTRPRIFVGDNGDAYAIYQAWQNASLTSTDIYVKSGDLVVQAATAAADWNDWRIIQTVTGPFVNEALVDPVRFNNGVMSVMMQDSPGYNYEWTDIRLFEFDMNE